MKQKHIFITQIERNDMHLLIIDDIIHSQNDVQLGINMIDASVQLHNALHLAASGVVPCISLEKRRAMLHTMNMFVDGIYKNDLKYCTICTEDWFHGNKFDDDNISYVCCRCVKEKKLGCDNYNVIFVLSMSAAKDMNPFHHINQVALNEHNDLELCYSLSQKFVLNYLVCLQIVMSLELEVVEELTLLTIRILLLGDKEYINGLFSSKTN